jgi:hypothetical protein
MINVLCCLKIESLFDLRKFSSVKMMGQSIIEITEVLSLVSNSIDENFTLNTAQ